MKKVMMLSIYFISIALCANSGYGADFCVTSASELTTALSNAQSNGQNDTIKVLQGVYTCNGSTFDYNSDEGHSITLQGGYTPGFASRVVNPSNTILDGENAVAVLVLTNTSGGNIQVEGFTIQNGSTENYGGGVYASTALGAGDVTLADNIITNNTTSLDGGGVYASSSYSSGTAGTVTLSNNIITGNTANDFAGGAYARSYSESSTAGTLVLVNNIIAGNHAGNNGGGVKLDSITPSGTSGPLYLINNTITENTSDNNGGGVIAYTTNNTFYCYNNIIRSNTAVSSGGDISLFSSSNYSYTNDYTDYAGSWTSETGKIDVDPQFIDPEHGDYRLRSISQCKDAGTNSPPSAPSTDFEGDTRIIDSYVDIGADEIFVETTCVSSATTLQDALTAAQSGIRGSVIMVQQGTYADTFSCTSNEGYNITLLGGFTPGCVSRVVNPANTILNGGNSGRTLNLYLDNGGDIHVDGFTITNGTTTESGGGLRAYATAPSPGTAGDITISNNIISGNNADDFGGGLQAYSLISSGTGTPGSVTLVNNIITDNTVDDSNAQGGGGAYVASSSSSGGNTVTITNNTISGNTATGGTSARGGGIFLVRSNNHINLYNNIIYGNTCSQGGDIYFCCSADSSILNSYYNNYSDIVFPSGNWTYEEGKIDADPRFTGDYHLKPGSPCIDTGTNSAPELPATDIDGDDRMIDGNRDGTATADIGADEYIPKGMLSFLMLLLN